MGILDVYVDSNVEKLSLYPSINIHKNKNGKRDENSILISSEEDILRIVVGNQNEEKSIKIPIVHNKYRQIIIYGEVFSGPGIDFEYSVSVLAIIHTYNEADIIERVVKHLLFQGIDVYLCDNWSKDGTYEVIQKICQENPFRVFSERFPKDINEVDNQFHWYKQLKRTEELTRELNYDWYIHYDADEIRISPWKNVTLRKAISYIDYLGYNGIENTVIDFRMTDQSDNTFPDGEYFDFRHIPSWINHLKTWKKNNEIDIKSTGGHRAIYKDQKIFPLHILNKHYSMRNFQQAKRKIFFDRKPRFSYEKNVLGWHGHYENYKELDDLFFEKSNLYKWNNETFDKLYLQLFMEIGIKWDDIPARWDIPLIRNRKIGIYGAGNAGRAAYLYLCNDNDINIWVDRDYEYFPRIFCMEINNPLNINTDLVDVVVVAIIDQNVQHEIKKYLNKCGFADSSIFYVYDL